MARKFKGRIRLDIRDSKQDWPAFLDANAPKGAPNVLIILYDDTGQAAWSAYGGRINMPTLDRLAKNGLTYTQWHTTAVCSPTRSTFLTGRNHHQNGCGSISESAVGFPGYSGHIPQENATIATVPVGYADGYPRASSSRAEVLIRGRRCRVAGNVTMDQLLVDCGELPVETGDEVVLLGRQGDESIRAEDWAARLGTIGYEIVCGISPRVPRVLRRSPSP